MNKRFVTLYWIFLFVPTFIISASLFNLLRQEQVRIVREVYATARERARTIAETIQITTRGVEHTIAQALLFLPADNVEELLLGFDRTSDLVSNVFLWTSENGLQYPARDDSSPLKDQQFVARYDDLFSGRVPWQHLRTLNEKKNLSSDASRLPDASPMEFGGWIPWFSDNEMSLLGWARRKSDGLIYGTEVNRKTLLSWLIVYFPEATPHSMEYALVENGSGNILHQTGNIDLNSVATPDVSVSLAPLLPYWKVQMYVVNPPLVAQAGKRFVILAGLLLGIFVTAIIIGGSLLIWQVQRNMTYAQQKTSFVSSVSHELKTPLTSIRMFADLLKEDRVKSPEKKNHYLQIIVTESQRLTRLVNNVLDFNRLEQGKKKYSFRQIEMPDYLHRIVEINRLRIEKAGLVLNNQIPEGKYSVRTDPDAIEQVCLNLIDNAIKYAAAGKELTLDLRIEDNYFKLWIKDRGPGIPYKHRTRIFEKFHRIDNSLTAPQPGSGLGLSIARGIMRELKGDVIFEPREGGGCCFIIWIPFRAEDNSETPKKGGISV